MEPGDWVAFEGILKSIDGYQKKETLSAEESMVLDQAVTAGVKIFCPGLLDSHPELPFLARMRVLEFYSTQITPEDTKKALTPLTGV
jgi:hypothetical protein